MTTTAPAERITLHCFKCRTRTEHERALASRPVYRCLGGCGNTREVEELGRMVIPGQASPVPPPTRPPETKADITKPAVKRNYTNRRTPENHNMSKSPLIAAIEKVVEAKLSPIVERIDKLENSSDVKGEIEKALSELLEVGGKPSSRKTAGEVVKCPRAPHKGRHGKLCREAGYTGGKA